MKRVIPLLVISIIVGAAAGLLGQKIIAYYHLDKKETFFAWVLGSYAAVAAFYLFKRQYTYVSGKGYLTAAEAEALPDEDDQMTAGQKLHQQNLVHDFPEPAIYDYDFYNNQLKTGFNFLLVLAAIAVAAYIAKGQRYFLAAVIGLPSLYIVRKVWNDFRDRLPQIRIAQQGIWIKALGYKPWEAIGKIKIVEESTGKSTYTRLQIFLKGTTLKDNDSTDDNEGLYPDINTDIDDIKNWKQIGMRLAEIGKVPVENDCP